MQHLVSSDCSHYTAAVPEHDDVKNVAVLEGEGEGEGDDVMLSNAASCLVSC
jgi:hypothetical protein